MVARQRQDGLGLTLEALLFVAFARDIGIVSLALGGIGLRPELFQPGLDPLEPRRLFGDHAAQLVEQRLELAALLHQAGVAVEIGLDVLVDRRDGGPDLVELALHVGLRKQRLRNEQGGEQEDQGGKSAKLGHTEPIADSVRVPDAGAGRLK